MKTSTKNATIILTNSESREAGHHGPVDSRDADSMGGVIRQEAHDLALRTGRHVEVYATRRGCQQWVVYACDAD